MHTFSRVSNPTELLLQYCMNLSYYMVLKTTGKAVKDHPVVDELIRLRTVMEKMRPLERKLKYQIDKLLKAPGGSGAAGAADPLRMRANIADLADSDTDGAGTGGTGGAGSGRASGQRANLADLADTESEDEEAAGARRDDLEVTPQTLASGVYRAPKQREVTFDGAEDPASRRRAEAARARQRAAKSALMSYIRDEYGDAPEEERNIGEGIYETADGADDEERARRAYEEDRFVRLTETRAQKQRQRNPRLVDELGNLGRLADLASLRGGRGGGDGDADDDDDDDDEDGVAAGAARALAEGRPRTLSEAMHGISRDALEAGRARARWLGEPAAGAASAAGAGGRGARAGAAAGEDRDEDEDEDIDSDTAYGPDGGDGDESDGDGAAAAARQRRRKQREPTGPAEVVVGRGAAKRAAREQQQAARGVFRGRSGGAGKTPRRGYNEDGTRDRRPRKKPRF